MTSWNIGGNVLGTPGGLGALGTQDNTALVIETAGQERVRVDMSGNVGVGTTGPGFKLQVGVAGQGTDGICIVGSDGHFVLLSPSRGGGGNNGITQAGDASVIYSSGSPNTGGFVIAPWNDGTNGIRMDNNGNVGIGTQTPTSALHVIGDVTVTGDILLTGADCAEDFDIAGSHPPDPGTVLAIDESGALRESREAYDKKVAGVVSGAAEYRHGLVLDKRSSREGRVSVGLVGKVYCKVDAQYSPIDVGDLLTTSPTPGHAMKAKDAERTPGSVIGKALQSLGTGVGLIPILIALQ